MGMDGWMNCYFMSFSTVFLPYQDDVSVCGEREGGTMKGCVQWNPICD